MWCMPLASTTHMGKCIMLFVDIYAHVVYRDKIATGSFDKTCKVCNDVKDLL